MTEQENTEHQRHDGGDGAGESPPQVIHAGSGDEGQQSAEGEAREATPRVVHAGGEETKEATPRVVHAGGEETKEAAPRVVRAAGEQAGEATPRLVRAGGETVRPAGESAQSAARIGETAAETARRMAAASFGTMADIARRDGAGQAVAGQREMRHFARSVESVVQGGIVLSTVPQQAVNEWLNYSQKAVERSSRAFGDLLRCRTTEEVVRWQAELLRSNVEDWLQTSIAIFDLSAQKAKEAADRMRQSGRQGAE